MTSPKKSPEGASSDNEAPDKVGYGKPPKASQWKKGQSGNKKGRPKGAKNLETVLRNELFTTIELKESGKKMKVSKLEALIKSQIAKAIHGDVRAATLVFKLLGGVQDQFGETESEPGLSGTDLAVLNDHAAFLALLKEATNGERED